MHPYDSHLIGLQSEEKHRPFNIGPLPPDALNPICRTHPDHILA